ncbi:hypothetical protein Fot_14723 [Forsythia ovata]|uniref:Uncharacterized protein n=1 Tax=Forsythia ovata TaxID=205694 RepID=A0ABD1W749_9LAMI
MALTKKIYWPGFFQEVLRLMHFTATNETDPQALNWLRFLPSNEEVLHGEDGGYNDFDISVDVFSCDDFKMFDFKVKTHEPGHMTRRSAHLFIRARRLAGGIPENTIIPALLAQILERVCIERVTPVNTRKV